MAAEARPKARPKARPTGQQLTWAGLTPDEHAEAVVVRARENVTKIPAEHRENVQRFRLRVLDDDVDREELYAFEGNRFTDPAAAIEHVRIDYPAEYAHGLYELAPVYFYEGAPDYYERTVPFGGPLNTSEVRYAVGYVRDYQDTSGHWCGETVSVTDYTDQASAEKLLKEVETGDPDFDGYFLLPDRTEDEDDYEEPPDDDSDPFDDGTIGYDYYGPSWPTRDI